MKTMKRVLREKQFSTLPSMANLAFSHISQGYDTVARKINFPFQQTTRAPYRKYAQLSI